MVLGCGRLLGRVPDVADGDRDGSAGSGPRDGSDDEDALSWAGDESLMDPEAPAVPAASASASAAPAAAAAPRPARPRAAQIVFLLVALASVAGWIAVVLRNPVEQSTLLGLAMYQLGELLAIAAPVLWWLVVRAHAARPLAWWVVGAVVTAPWPLLIGGVV